MSATLEQIAQHNAERRLDSQNWCLGVYWCAGFAMVFLSGTLSIVVGWNAPQRIFSSLPGGEDVRVATMFWGYPVLLLYFLITAGTGITGWAVIGVFFLLSTLTLACRGAFIVHRNKTRSATGAGPVLNPDGSISAQQEVLERELLKQFMATRKHVSTIQLRVAKILARYNPDKLESVEEMLHNYAHTEERLIVDLKRKYGPEPEVTSSDSVAQGRRSSWRRVPFPMSAQQLACAVVNFVLLLVCLGVALCIVFLWPIEDYLVAERAPTPLGPPQPQVEIQRPLTAKSLQLMYAWPGLASDLRLQQYLSWLTEYCGDSFTETLESESARQIIYREWIQPYSINMSQFIPSDWRAYSSVNAWFTRAVRPEARPLQYSSDDTVVSAPADARYVVFHNVSAATKMWIKGGRFTWQRMVDFEAIDGDPDYFEGGTVVVARLAPQDYHRFHSPVSASVRSVRFKEGSLWSVNADAVLSANDVFLNQRQIAMLDVGGTRGVVAFVAVGATCVGSVVMHTRVDETRTTPLQIDSRVRRGDELGLMQFGGSTIVLLFRRGAFIPACDLLQASAFPAEMYLKFGAAIGRFSADATYAGIHERCEHM